MKYGLLLLMMVQLLPKLTFCQTVDLSGTYIFETYIVGTGTVTINGLVQRDSSITTEVVPVPTSSSWDVLGIATATVTGNGSNTVNVARYGQMGCTVDAIGAGTSTAGNLAIMGITNPIDCADSGQANIDLIPIGTRVVGYFLTTKPAGSAATVELTPGLMGTQITGVPISATSFSTSSNMTIGGTLSATGTVSSGTSSNAPGCIHLSDAGGSHDMGFCAPSSGVSGTFTLPTSVGSSNNVMATDGSNNLSFIGLGSIAGTLGSSQMPAFTGDVTNSGLAMTVGKIGGKAISLMGPLTTCGGFGLQFTTTAATNVTLPVSGRGRQYSCLSGITGNQRQWTTDIG